MFNDSYTLVTPPPKIKKGQALKTPPGISSPLGSIGPVFIFLLPSRPDVIPGITLMKVLAGRIKQTSKIEVVRDFYITEILKNEGKVYGVKGFDKTGEESIIEASAIILATGGAGAIYLRNDNQKTIMGQGYFFSSQSRPRIVGYGIHPILSHGHC